MKLNQWTLGLAAVGLVSLGSVAHAEEKLVPLTTALSSTTLSGYVDTSAVWNPGTGNANPPPFAFNAGKQDGFNLNAVNLTLEKPLDEAQWSAGYRVDVALGPDGPLVTGGGPIRQAYVNLRAPVGNGLDFKVGRFDTIIGYESFDGYKNPNYTRSYGYTIEPTEHTGVLMSYQVSEVFSFSAGIANTLTTLGINDRSPRAESHKAYMGSVSITAPESTGFLSGSALYAGIIDGYGNASEDQTSLYVGGTLATPVAGLKLGASYDQVHHLRGGAPITVAVDPVTGVGTTGIGEGYASAIALYASFKATEKLGLNLRAEYAKGGGLRQLSSRTIPGDALLGTPDTLVAGGPGKVVALTGTLDYSLWQNVVSRLEVRWDHAADGSRPFGGTSPGQPDSKNDLMVAANLIYKF